MRAPIIGVYWADDPVRREAHVLASTHMTHRHPLADDGALLVAHAAAGARSLVTLIASCRTQEFRSMLQRLEQPLERGDSVMQVASTLGLGQGVTGFILHTVPIALYAWLRHPDDFRRAVEDAIACGGDTDTTAAIVGALAGASLGADAIPHDWLAGIWEWPRSVRWLRRLAQSDRPLGLFVPGLLIRAVVQMAIVLGHGFRRLAPPYAN
jgi:ADP-ribosylglycohydrolase